MLDPMVGSGTTIVLAKMMGHRAYGIDIDPLAVLLAESWASTRRSSTVLDGALAVMKAARSRLRHLKQRDAYPVGADDETKAFVRFWFDADARIQLRALVEAIVEVSEEIRPLLWSALSRTIITKARGVSLAMDLSHSRPHKAFERAPVRPFDAFPLAAQFVVKSGPFIDHRDFPKSKYPDVNVVAGDARKISHRSASFDLVITSPPYLNAIDYIRCSKFALVWMGKQTQELRQTRSTSIGSEVSVSAEAAEAAEEVLERVAVRKRLPDRWCRILDRYILDMHRVVKETVRVLKPGGRAVFVMGDSRVRGISVSNSRIVEALARDAGLRLEDREIRKLVKSRRYLPPPSKANGTGQLDDRMGQEVILRFTRARE